MQPFQISMPSLGRRNKATRQEQQAAEERVSLIDLESRQPNGSPVQRRKKRVKKSTTLRTQDKKRKQQQQQYPWTLNRLMRYLSLTAFSALMTFVYLGRESKALHWQEFNHLLEPDTKIEQRCFNERRHGENERCTCPDPTQALANTESEWWEKHHNHLVSVANRAKKDLDIVFFGDEIVERLDGTSNLGSRTLGGGMREPFEQLFTKAGGGDLEGLALGSSSDTGPNMLWHIENGLIDNINPKVWFISVGGNELFREKCTDRIVVASILQVLKAIAERKPGAAFVIHGILPRKDDPRSKSQFLKKNWKYAQTINTHVRKFCEHAPRLYYMQAGPLFLQETEEARGRRVIDSKLLEDGVLPTKEGLMVWGEYIAKKVKNIIEDLEESKAKGLKGSGRSLEELPATVELV
mmetsp:Transcript_62961/g.181111  ORF Transcript_62961/g.181111 Transcript_62961/m.181111 type:complete len:409 (-) Transcript_62961:1197-2423(-)